MLRKGTVCIYIGEIEPVAQSGNNNEEVNGKSEVGEGGGGSNVGEASSSKKAKPPSICRFCDKEFATAQGLGGHMNGHRLGNIQNFT